MKAKIIKIEYPVRYDAVMSCEAFRQHARVTQPRLSIPGCFALLHAIRAAKPQNPSRLHQN
jgi:hypothetical protein